MAYVLAVGAALANALNTILQRMGVESAPDETTLRWGLMAYALKRKVWLAGFAFMVAAFLFQFTALHFGRLTTVQPILTLELPFLVAILGIWFRQQLGWHEWVGAVLATGGLAAFLSVAAPGGGNQTPSLQDWGLVSLAVIGGGTVAVMLTRVGSPAWKATMFGSSAAIAFAFTAALTKQTNVEIGHGWSRVFLSWPPYALAASGLAGLFLTQNAFRVGPVTASQSALVIVDPLASIIIGIGLFGDRVQTGGGRGVGEVLALIVLFAGVYSLTRSPLIIGVKTEDGDSSHILSQRHRGLGGRSDSPDWTSGDPATAPG
ncbi:MAG: DMT family transporter [Acidimicrobiales bacterium]